MNYFLLIALKLAVLPLPFFNSPGTLSKVADPIFVESDNCGFPCTGCDYTITISCATGGAHIFYTKDGTIPTHTGDTPTGTTLRIGASSGTIATGHLGKGVSKSLTFIAIGYLAGDADSNPIVDNIDLECASNS